MLEKLFKDSPELRGSLWKLLKQWFLKPGNRLFLGATAIYVILTFLALYTR